MSAKPPPGQALATAGRDADATFSDAPLDEHVAPCLDSEETVEIFFDDPFRGPCRNVLVHLAYASGAKESLRSDFRGVIRVKKTRGKFADTWYRRAGETQKRLVFLRPEQAPSAHAAWQRLVNMGYVGDLHAPASPDSPMKLYSAVQAFQADFQLAVTGALDETTRRRIEREHADGTPWRNREWPRPADPTPTDSNRKGSLT